MKILKIREIITTSLWISGGGGWGYHEAVIEDKLIDIDEETLWKNPKVESWDWWDFDSDYNRKIIVPDFNYADQRIVVKYYEDREGIDPFYDKSLVSQATWLSDIYKDRGLLEADENN